MKKNKILNLCLVLFSLIGYLEWGGDNSMFLFQGEIDIIQKFIENPTSILHPFILLPLFGQVILIYTLFQKTPSKLLTFLGMGGIGLLLLLMFVIGLISFNFKILLSTLPFLGTAILTIIHYRKSSARES